MLVKIYTDGSYSVSTPNVTKGAMIALVSEDGKDKVLFAQRYLSTLPEIVKSRNAGGELIAAGFAVATVAHGVIKDGDGDNVTIKIYHDYTGVQKFMQPKPDGWSANKEASTLYVALMNTVKKKYPKLNIQFQWVKSHNGDFWNHKVDMLAAGTIPEECKQCMLATVEYNASMLNRCAEKSV